jgi:hypothetical protein
MWLVTHTDWMDVGGWTVPWFEPVREVFARILAGQGGTGAAAAASSVRLSVRELLLFPGRQIQRAT